MKIGIDIKSAFEPKRSGIGNSIYHLVKNILLIDNSNEYFLFSEGKSLPVFQNKKVKVLNRRNPFSLIKYLDVFHGPDFKLLPVLAKKKVVTIHDLASSMTEDFMSEEFKKLTQQKIKKSLKDADAIIAVSHSVKKEILNYYNLEESRIQVVYHGINEDFQKNISEKESKIILNNFGILQPFILFVGNLETRKNIIVLLQAFSMFKEKYKTNHQLVLVGKSGYGFEKIQHELNINPVKKDIKNIGWIEDDNLSVIFSTAELFLFPSLYEGFGLPILEAMKYELPVICSNIPALKEIAADAALFIDPHFPEEISDTIYKLLSNSSVKNEMIKKGSERINDFSWKKTAGEMVTIYES